MPKTTRISSQGHIPVPHSSLPREWELVPLENLCLSPPRYGANTPAIDRVEGYPRYVRITDIDGSGYLMSDSWRSIDPDSASEYMLHEGDMVFARSGATAGKAYLYRNDDGPCAFAGYLIRFQPDPRIIIPELLFHYAHSDAYYEWVRQIARQTAQPNINAKEYGSLLVPVPPMSEQKKIVDILAANEVSILHTQKVVEKSKALRAAVMQRLLTRGIGHTRFKKTEIGEIPEGWKVMKLGNFSTPSRETIEPRHFPDEAFVLYSIPAYHNTGSPENCLGRNIGSMKQLVRTDTVLFGALNPKVPKVWFVSAGTRYRQIASTEFFCLAGNNGASPRFIYHLCQSAYLLERSTRLTRGTTTSRMRVDREAFLSLPVPVPPIEEQVRIAEILDTVDAYSHTNKRMLDELSGLKKELMQILLTGKVRLKV